MNKLDRLIALHGSYYGHNFGDVLLMQLFSQWIREEATSRVRVVLPQAKLEVLQEIGGDLNGFLRLRPCDAIIYGGGGYFGEPPIATSKWSLRNMIRHLPSGEFMRLRGKPLAIIGVGVGPISNRFFRRRIKALAEAAEVLAVRDEESADYLTNLGVSHVEIVADAALSICKDDLLSEHVEKAKEQLSFCSGTPSVAIHLAVPSAFHGYLHPLTSDLEAFMTTNTDVNLIFISDGFRRRVYPFVGHMLSKYPNRINVVPYEGPWSLVALLGQVDMVITNKLHVGIVASALGTPTLSFPFHSKTPRFWSQIGSPERCVPLVKLRPGVAKSLLEDQLASDSSIEVPEYVRRSAARCKELVQSFVSRVNNMS